MGTSCFKDVSYTVGYLNASANRQKFVQEGGFMAQRLKELGHEVILVAAEDNGALQLSQGYELLDQGVDVLVIVSVNGITIAPLVRDAHNRGVKVVADNRLINNAEFDLFVTGDNEGYARFFCETALEQNPVGNYVVLGGDRFDMNGFELMQHIQSILQPHVEWGRVNLIYETYIEGWNRGRAEFEMQQVIEAYGKIIDVVIACNDPMGMGAYEVLKQYDAHHGVVVTGQGAYADVVKSIYNEGMFMTIYHPAKELGYQTADLIDGLLKG
jgi:D-xylose transport system substrate-binding protein